MSENSEKGPDNEKKVMFIVTQDGCPPCPDYAKMATEAAPKDITVKEIKLGRSQDVDSLVTALGVQMTPTALYMENGEVKRLITPSGKSDDDRAAIANVEKSEGDTGNEAVRGCAATFRMEPEGWRLGLNGGQECEDAAKAMQSLGPGGKKNLARHVASEDHAVKELLKQLS